MDITVHGLVLREVNYKEADKILTILTKEEGKLTVSARGCRRKNSRLTASAQLLVYSEFTLYQRQNRWSIREGNPENLFWGVRQDVEKLSLAAFFGEVCELVSQEELDAAPILSLILNCLYALDQLNKPIALVKAAFQWKLLALAGYEPMLDGCAVCGKEPAAPMLHLRAGVLHCKACRQRLGAGVSMPLDGESLSAIRHVVLGNPKRLFSFSVSPEALARMDSTGEGFLLTQLERGFHTLDFYKQLTQSGIKQG